MDIKNTLMYKFAKRTYLAGVHFVCDSKRKPLVKPLADSILNTCVREGEGITPIISTTYQS